MPKRKTPRQSPGKGRTSDAGAKPDVRPTDAAASPGGPPLDREGQWWNAQFSVLPNAVKDLWERFALTPQ